MPASTTDDLLHALGAVAAAPIEEAFALPPGCYTDAGFFALEAEKVFGRDWICIGRASDMPSPGDSLTLDLPGASVIAVRQKDGGVQALSRVCRHRGALVGSEGGRLLVCPYHRWTYELDGTLRGAPTLEGNPAFRREDCALPRCRTELWEGFVFFSLNPDAQPLGPRLAAVSDRARAHDLGRLQTGFQLEEVWDANWKVAFENGSESYHHLGVHQRTLEPAFPALGSRCETGEAAYSLHVVPAIEGLAFRWAGTEPQFLIVAVYPGLVLVFSGEVVTWFGFTPVDAGRTRLRVGWLSPPERRTPERLEEDRALLEAILAEDRVSCAGVQRGLAARDAASGPLSPLERTIAEFVRYLDRRLNGEIRP